MGVMVFVDAPADEFIGEALGDHVAHAALEVGDADAEVEGIDFGAGEFDPADGGADLGDRCRG